MRFALVVVLAAAGLQAQQVTYLSSPGTTSISGYYDPNAAAKGPSVSTAAGIIPFLPAVPMDQYQAQKDAMSKFSQSNFILPLTVDTPGPKAPGGASAPPIAAAPTASWEGLQDTGFQPPTPDLAVGPNDVLMVVNSNIGQFTRSGTLKKLTSFQDWFSNVLTNVCAVNCLIYDPWITYDQEHGHFLFLASVAPVTQQSRTYSYLLVSVSNGATYDSGWKNWALNASMDGSTQTLNWGDSWRLGLDNMAVYLSGNMYNTSGNFQYAKIRVIRKSDLYKPTLTTLPYQEFGSATAKLKNFNDTVADSLMPVHQRGRPGETATGFFVNAGNVPAVPANFLTTWKVNDPLANPLTITESNVTGVLPYNVPAPAPQLGTPSTLDTADTRLLKAIYRNGFLYTARGTGYTDQATTVTFDVIDTSTMRLASQARLLNTNAFYPAFDVPATVPAGAQFATSNVITGTTTGPDGSLTYPGISRLKAGEGPFNINFGGISRYGDYFGGAVDPVSGGLWVSGQYAKPPQGGFGIWGTWAGLFPWLTTQSFSDVPATSPYFDYVNVLSSWQITTGCSPTQFCPTTLVTRDQLATLIIRSMLGNTFTYTTTPYFTDVPASSPYFPFIQKLMDLGITTGCTPTTFCPSGTVPRMDAAVLIVRAKLKSLLGDEFTYPTTPFFGDVSVDSAQFRFIQKMYELGLTSGCTPTQFCPNNLLTRQEIAVFLTRAFLN